MKVQGYSIYRNTIPAVILFLFISAFSLAQENDTAVSVEEMNKKRQNPVEGLRSVFLQGIFIPGTGDGTAQSYSLQPVWPFRIGNNVKLITYTILPYQQIPALYEGGESVSGLGNILFNGYFSPMHSTGKLVWGAGPAVQLPTRTDPALASNRVSLGPSGLLYLRGDVLSGGIVAQNYWSLGGEGINKVNMFSLQYIAYCNFNKGWFALSNSTIVADWLADEEQWLVPVGGGVGKTFKMGKKFYCGDLQLFYNAVRPEPVGNFQIIFQFQVII